MKHLKFILFLIPLFLFIHLHAENVKDKLVLGNKDSPIEVYFVSDWFCSSCKKAESAVDAVLPKIQSKVAFYFIDYAVNPESINYSPYNLSFLANNKPQYLKIRRMMDELTEKTESPREKDITAIANKANITFKELSYNEIKAGMDFFDSIAKKYDIHATPALIVVNQKSQKVIKLEGAKKIKEKNILQAIHDLEE